MAKLGTYKQLYLIFAAVKDCSWLLRSPAKEQFGNIHVGNFKCCSDRTNDLPHWGYNCIAWAAGKTDQWWWPIAEPGTFWPIKIDPIDPTSLQQFIRAFEFDGYSVCKHSRFENGYEKVAIFVGDHNEVTHAARMLPDGVWTSKMGKGEDIEQETLEVVEGRAYGKAVAFLRRNSPLFRRHLKLVYCS